MSAPGYPPGVWVDEAGTLHFDVAAMLRGAGYEPTAENIAAMEKAAQDMAGRIGAEVRTVLEPDSRGCEGGDEAPLPADGPTNGPTAGADGGPHAL